jgi:urea transport system ATP-binding protein
VRTADLIRSLRRPDRTILVIEHDMAFVEAIADRVTVLHEGRTLFEGGMAGARADTRVVEVFLGR